MGRTALIWIIPLLLGPLIDGVESQNKYGVIKLRVLSEGETTENTTKEFCFSFSTKLFSLPQEPSKSYHIADATEVDVCNDTAPPLKVGNGTLLLMQQSDNCSLPNYISYAKKRQGVGFFLYRYNDTKGLNDSSGLEIFGAIGNYTMFELKKYIEWRGDDVVVKLYTVEDSIFSSSIIFLWITACLCVAIGSLTGPYQDLQWYVLQFFWALVALGLLELRDPRTKIKKKVYRHNTSSRQQILEGSSTSSTEAKNVQVSFTVTLVLTLVVFITATLLLLYFFYEYLVYFFMAIFCFASGRATYEILNQIAHIFKFDACMPRIRGCGLHRIFLATLCIALPILWFVFRHNDNIWILQDFLGICFCIHIIQTLRIPNLQICTVLLTLLFFYDVFFVFVTPYFTTDGKSVMVEVATGGNSGESLPLLIKFPRSVGPGPCSAQQSYSLLGFGDIIVPGFLVCFGHSFDIIRGDKFRPYFIVTMIGYVIGLAIAFVALFISQTGQPALLYIVPCTLAAICVTAVFRKQFGELWRGSITITEVEP